ncbi:hypothetical protein A3J44_03780 [candidate division WOR-1 bacterium RIFCSPHIGHO2_02_FULL_45_12]|nr:MAG: hypothetical protein A3J44_03780 [candidate division WOR-1 bacterium RIFCSPHIGHO2_02_FULL_45_12]
MCKKSLIIILLFPLFFAINLGKVAEAKRIVSLAPSITEILFLLNLDEQIVGVTTNCDYPQKAEKLEKVGLFESPNLEKIISLKPDLVLAPDSGQNSAISRLRDLNIQTVILPSQNMKDVFKSIETVGALTDKEKIAKISLYKMQERINKIKKRVADQPCPRALVIIWATPNTIMTAGRKSFINELINLAGGKNITASIDYCYPMISPEFVLDKNPDVIIFGNSLNSKEIVKDLLTQPGIRNTRAVRSGRIYRNLNPDLFLRPGPRLIAGLEEIARILHPNIFITKEEGPDEKT